MKVQDTPFVKEALLSRLRDRSAVIGIVGMGYVGLPLALRFAEVQYTVHGFDIDGSKVEALNAGRSYIEHIPARSIQEAAIGTHEVSSNMAGVRQTANDTKDSAGEVRSTAEGLKRESEQLRSLVGSFLAEVRAV